MDSESDSRGTLPKAAGHTFGTDLREKLPQQTGADVKKKT